MNISRKCDSVLLEFIWIILFLSSGSFLNDWMLSIPTVPKLYLCYTNSVNTNNKNNLQLRLSDIRRVQLYSKLIDLLNIDWPIDWLKMRNGIRAGLWHIDPIITDFSILRISYNRFWQYWIQFSGPFKSVKAGFDCFDYLCEIFLFIGQVVKPSLKLSHNSFLWTGRCSETMSLRRIFEPFSVVVVATQTGGFTPPKPAPPRLRRLHYSLQ